MKIACITEKDMFIWEKGRKIEIPSQYLQKYQKNLQDIQRKKNWKQKSITLAMAYDGSIPDLNTTKLGMDYKITGLSPCSKSSSLIYSIQIEQMSGIFKLNPFDKDELEGHIYHDKGVTISNPSYNKKNASLLYSLREQGNDGHIVCQNLKSGDTVTLTDGDSVDDYPRWSERAKDTLVYQSSGIGRDAKGFYVGLAPSTIHSMNIKSGEITEILKFDGYDCLAPIIDKSGSLYFICRPFKSRPHQGMGNFLMDIILFPFRLINALFHWLNFFTMAYSGKPLTSGKNPARNDADPRKLLIHGNLIDAKTILNRRSRSNPSALGLVPQSWQLIKRSSSGEQKVLDRGLIAFDLHPSGQMVCSNGRCVYLLNEEGEKTILIKDKFVEKVYFL